MKALLLFIILVTYSSVLPAQEIWFPFRDTLSELTGYKDSKGNIMIAPKFKLVSGEFDNIIAVVENTPDTWRNYYLLKNGREIGVDSVDLFEFTPPCESEGKITFIDRKKNAKGVLNEKGEVIIPAIYNVLYPFKNGIAVAYRNAKLKCADEGVSLAECEHAGWVDGEWVMINEKNEILAEGIGDDFYGFNWYSMQTNLENPDTNLYVTIAGNNNINYSFIDFQKEFELWFEKEFLPGIRHDTIGDSLLFPEITYWDKGWKILPATEFLKTYPGSITHSRFISSKTKMLSAGRDELNYLIYNQPHYRKYRNIYDENYHRYFPYFDLSITYFKPRQKALNDTKDEFLKHYEIDYQEHYGFLKTEWGYRLISATIPK